MLPVYDVHPTDYDDGILPIGYASSVEEANTLLAKHYEGTGWTDTPHAQEGEAAHRRSWIHGYFDLHTI